MIEYKLRYRVDFSCYCFIICPFTEIMLPFWGERVVVHLLLQFIFCFSSLFRLPIFDQRHRPHPSLLCSRSTRKHICNTTQKHMRRSRKSSRTEKKGVRFFLNICSLLCSRVLILAFGLKRSVCICPMLEPNMLTEKPFHDQHALLGPKRTAGH